jgi:hypothetical protein
LVQPSVVNSVAGQVAMPPLLRVQSLVVLSLRILVAAASTRRFVMITNAVHHTVV